MSDVYVDDVDWKETAKDLASRIERAEALHLPISAYTVGGPEICERCSDGIGEDEVPYPCPTRQALDGPHDTGDDA